MNLKTTNPQHIQVLEVIGRIDNGNINRLAKALDNALAQERPQMVLDMSSVTFINSAGLRELVRIFKHLQGVGGMVHILNPSEQVQRLLELVGLDSVFHIYFDPAWNIIPNNQTPATPRQICYLA